MSILLKCLYKKTIKNAWNIWYKYMSILKYTLSINFIEYNCEDFHFTWILFTLCKNGLRPPKYDCLYSIVELLNKILFSFFWDDKVKTERELPPFIYGRDFKCQNFHYKEDQYFHIHGGIEFDISTPSIENASEDFKVYIIVVPEIVRHFTTLSSYSPTRRSFCWCRP